MIATETPCMMISNAVLTRENAQLKKEPSEQHNLGGMIGSSKAMQDVLALIRTIAGVGYDRTDYRRNWLREGTRRAAHSPTQQAGASTIRGGQLRSHS